MKGFTLIELLIYLAVMSLAIVSLTTWSLSISGNERRILVDSEIQASGRFVAEQVARQVRQTVAVVSPELGTSDSSAKFDLGLTEPTVFEVSDGRLIMTDSSGSWPLTGEKLEVKNFVVTNRSSTARQSHLDFALTLAYRDADSREFAVEKTFNFSASSRK